MLPNILHLLAHDSPIQDQDNNHHSDAGPHHHNQHVHSDLNYAGGGPHHHNQHVHADMNFGPQGHMGMQMNMMPMLPITSPHHSFTAPASLPPGHGYMTQPHHFPHSSTTSAIANQPLESSSQYFDHRFAAFRKISKTLRPAVLLKSWQRVCMLVAGIETIREVGSASVATLESEVYDRYHGNSSRHPPIVGTVRRAMDDCLDMLATDKFGIKFPKDRISYVQMTANMPAVTIWRYYKELVIDVTSRINLVYRHCLLDDLSFPEGKNLYDVLEDTLKALWDANDQNRRRGVVKRMDLLPEDDDGDEDGHDILAAATATLTAPTAGNGNEASSVVASSSFNAGSAPAGTTVTGAGLAQDDAALQFAGAKRVGVPVASMLHPKAFPGVGKFQPIPFLAFLLLGPPAGEKCWSRFRLDEEHMSSAPMISSSRARPTQSLPLRHSNTHGLDMSADEDDDHDDENQKRARRKRPRSMGAQQQQQQQQQSPHLQPHDLFQHQQLHMHPQHVDIYSAQRGGLQFSQQPTLVSRVDEQQELLRVFQAETAARAQRLEELKVGLALFPEDEAFKLELKQFIETARSTHLPADALAKVGLQSLH